MEEYKEHIEEIKKTKDDSIILSIIEKIAENEFNRGFEAGHKSARID